LACARQQNDSKHKVVVNNFFRDRAPATMFHSTNGPVNKKDKLISDETIFQFTLAEFSSAIEMIQATKKTGNNRLKLGFIRHALDEYRHLDFFRTVLKQRKSEYLFIPNLSIENNYIDTKKYLFEKMNLIKFSAFVAVNERFAFFLFGGLRNRLFVDASPLDVNLEEIIQEEKIHHQEALQGKFFDHLLQDELGHYSHSMKFLLKNTSFLFSKYLILKYTIQNRLRHFFGRENFLKSIFESAIFSFVKLILILASNVMFFELKIGKFSENKKCIKMMI